jgi:hypothetical protein
LLAIICHKSIESGDEALQASLRMEIGPIDA